MGQVPELKLMMMMMIRLNSTRLRDVIYHQNANVISR